MHPDLTARVAAMESQLRRWRVTTICLALVFAIVILAAFQVPNPRRPFPGDPGSMVQLTPGRIASHSFVLVGTDGTVYARLTAQNGAPVMDFYDAQGHVIWSAPPRAGVIPVTAQPRSLQPVNAEPRK